MTRLATLLYATPYILGLCALAYVLALFLATSAQASEIRGTLDHVIDGDSIVVRGVEIRLEGLHAPEWNQPGGKQAKAFMRSQFGGQTLSCKLTGEISYDRVIGQCWDRTGRDIAAALIAAGLGRDCPRFSGGRYRQFETRDSARFPLPRYC